MRYAIFPARGGSVRIPRKNIRDFRGRPMIQWPIEAARASGLFDRIIVSTDDIEIKELAIALGHEVHIRQPDDGTTGTQEIAAHVLEWLRATPEDVVCVIYPCSPLLEAHQLVDSHAVWARRERERAYVDDAGCLYWGRARSFVGRVPLEGNTFAYYLYGQSPQSIDINTEEDWSRAEAMFDALHHHGATT